MELVLCGESDSRLLMRRGSTVGVPGVAAGFLRNISSSGLPLRLNMVNVAGRVAAALPDFFATTLERAENGRA